MLRSTGTLAGAAWTPERIAVWVPSGARGGGEMEEQCQHYNHASYIPQGGGDDATDAAPLAEYVCSL